MLNVPHSPQTNPNGRNTCVPACLKMVLAYQGVNLSEQYLCDHLETELAGTPLWNLLTFPGHLENCRVEIDSSSMHRLGESLASNLPPVVFVATRHWDFWPHETIHAVVVVGIEKDTVFINDPFFADAPRGVTTREFLSAWSELDFLTAIVSIEH